MVKLNRINIVPSENIVKIRIFNVSKFGLWTQNWMLSVKVVVIASLPVTMCDGVWLDWKEWCVESIDFMTEGNSN
jgi:hypothetical protein